MTTSKTSTRDRRDWTLLIFIIPIGIILMLIAGQIAIRLVPFWSVKAGMLSNLDPNSLPMQQSGPVQPLLPAILTPIGWLETFLTPGSDGYDIISDFIVLDPSATVTTAVPTTATVVESPTASVTVSSPTIVVTTPVTVTTHPTDIDTETPITLVPTETTVVPTTEVPTTVVPTTEVPTTVVPTTEVPTTVVPTTAVPTTAVPTTAVPTTAVPTATSITSTPIGTQILITPVDLTIGPPNGSGAGNLADGNFYILDLGLNPIIVNGTSDTGYDLVYYDLANPDPTNLFIDSIILGISQSPTGAVTYNVFNWGDGIPDMNSNVGVTAAATGMEIDNQAIDTTTLYGTAPLQTGIAIDVDNAVSAPPVGEYQYLIIQAPITVDNDGVDLDAVEVPP